jgi:spermidine synthase
VVCDFCHAHLEKNRAAFESPRLELINDDARSQLEAYPGKFDVIIGDLADPLEGGPCYQLYTQVHIDAATCLVCRQKSMQHCGRRIASHPLSVQMAYYTGSSQLKRTHAAAKASQDIQTLAGQATAACLHNAAQPKGTACSSLQHSF